MTKPTVTPTMTTCWVCEKLTDKDAAYFDGYDTLHYELYLCPECLKSAVAHGLDLKDGTDDACKPQRGPIGRGLP